jgi:signal transduction histidine kinase/CheY-like chemotaxis protein
VLVTVALAAFTWFAVARVQADLIRRGIERAEGAATTLASQTSQSAQLGLTRLNQIASGPELAALIRSPTDEAKTAVIKSVTALPTGAQEQVIEVWDASGHRIMDAALPASATAMIPLETAPPTVPGLQPLLRNGDALYTRTVSEIPRNASRPEDGRAGYFVVSRVLRSAASSALLNGVVGTGATVMVANQSGSIWTDLGRVLRPPVIDLNKAGGREFTGPNGEAEIGAPVPITGTPWVMVVAFPRSVILAPARQLLGRLAGASLLIIVVATLAARALSNRVTKPLAELTRAAQAMELGDYSRRVVAEGPDEVGQLAHAFNAMAEQVETGRRALEAHAAELSLSREAARQANVSKDEFLAVLSHELRTPLNAILGWCHILGAGVTPPGGTPHAIRVIERNAKAQLRLVEDLLDISRIVSGRFVLEKELVDPGVVVNAAVESIQPSLIEKEISIVINRTAGSESRYINGDAGRLQQAVWNLLSNAIKFTPRLGAVEIDIRDTGAGLEIAVRDNGEGISADALPIIFDRLQQGDNGAARKHGGLGLGLAIVRQIVELHQGTVTAESDGPGCGATFRIYLPTVSPQRVADGPAARSAIFALPSRPNEKDEHASVRGVRILVVEDSDDARELMVKLLSAEGAIVTASAGAESALAWIESHHADVIVSDIGMPGQDGWQMMQAIRSRHSKTMPAIALTAHATSEDRDRSMASGFQEHLTKPVDIAELLRTIARLAS